MSIGRNSSDGPAAPPLHAAGRFDPQESWAKPLLPLPRRAAPLRFDPQESWAKP
jgi:hypothetical protein